MPDYFVTSKCLDCEGTGRVEDYRDREQTCWECEGHGSTISKVENYDNIYECAEDYPDALSIEEGVSYYVPLR